MKMKCNQSVPLSYNVILCSAIGPNRFAIEYADLFKVWMSFLAVLSWTFRWRLIEQMKPLIAKLEAYGVNRSDQEMVEKYILTIRKWS